MMIAKMAVQRKIIKMNEVDIDKISHQIESFRDKIREAYFSGNKNTKYYIHKWELFYHEWAGFGLDYYRDLLSEVLKNNLTDTKNTHIITAKEENK